MRAQESENLQIDIQACKSYLPRVEVSRMRWQRRVNPKAVMNLLRFSIMEQAGWAFYRSTYRNREIVPCRNSAWAPGGVGHWRSKGPSQTCDDAKSVSQQNRFIHSSDWNFVKGIFWSEDPAWRADLRGQSIVSTRRGEPGVS